MQALLDELGKMRGHLPDAQVIEGWRHLRGDPPALSPAQEAFVAAGLHTRPPVYAEGLRLLIDGLQLFCAAPGTLPEIPLLREVLRPFGHSSPQH